MKKILPFIILLITSLCSGTGTPDDPYLISDCYELQNIINNLSAHYALSNDIDCSMTENWNWNEIEGIYNGFEPSTSYFRGSFDGRSFVVKNLYINRPSQTYVGLFGRISDDVIIKNVGLINVSVVGNERVGSLVGYSERGRVINSYASGNVSGNENVGGLVGSLLVGSIESSHFTGNVKGNKDIGGLLGRKQEGGVRNSFSIGRVEGNENVGGLVGVSSVLGIVRESYSISSVNGTTNVGGLVGYNGRFEGYSPEIINSYSTGSVKGNNNVGGLVGRNTGKIIDSFYHNHSQNPSFCAGNGSNSGCNQVSHSAHPPYFYKTDNPPMDNWDFENIWESQNEVGYPFLKNLPNPYTLETNYSLFLFPSVNYNNFENKIKILVYAYDPIKGEEVNFGSGSYKISNSSLISSGVLSYTSRWFGSENLVLASGDYVLEVNINNNIRNVEFKVVEGVSIVSGDLKDSAGNELGGVLVEIFKFNNFPDLSYSFIMADNSYSFEVEPGEYIVRARKGTAESVTLAFSVFGGQEITKNLILSEKENLDSAMFDLKEKFLSKASKEASMMAELTEWARKDLGSAETEALKEMAENIISEGSEGIDLDLLLEFVKSKSQAFKYKAQLENLTFILRESALDSNEPEEVFEVFEWLAFSDEEGKIPERTTENLRNTTIYKKSLHSLEDLYNSFSLNYSEEFDFSKARKIIGDQITQIEGLYSSENIHLLPNSEESPFSWTFIQQYDNYKKAHGDLLDGEGAKKVGFSVSVAAGVVTGVITGLATSASGPVAVASGIAVGVGTFTKIQATLIPFNYIIDGVGVATSMIAGQSYVFAASEWTLDLIRTPQTYDQIISFLEKESQEPYYLNKNNSFDSEVSIEIYPDEIEDGKGIYYLITHPYSSGLTGNSLVMEEATINVRNLYTPAETRVFSQTQLLEESGWGNNKRKIFSFLGGNYFSEDLSMGEEVTKDITFQAIEKSFTIDAQVLVVQVFSGPFQTAIEKEHFLIVPRVIEYLPYSSKGGSAIRSLEIPVREKEKQLTIRDYLGYAQNVIDIKDVDSSEFSTFGGSFDGNGDIVLDRENPEFEFEYTAGDLYGAEFQLFYPFGTDVDLQVCENDSCIGFNQLTGQEEIGFPGTYSGKYTMPEVIYIPQVKNKTYKIKAILVKENSDMPVQVKMSVLEEPFRPALLSIYPSAINEVFLKQEKFNLSFSISEIGGQKPLENVSVELEIPSINYSKSYFFEQINAGNSQEVTFDFDENEMGIFEGKLKVNSSAGYMEINVSVQIKDVFGDTDNDSNSDLFDLATLGKAYGSLIGKDNWKENADLNKDQKIDIFDLIILEEDYGKEY
ncbi:MAG: GLUG motif-containing protein [Candidatus Pacearchaeota archaeon]